MNERDLQYRAGLLFACSGAEIDTFPLMRLATIRLLFADIFQVFSTQSLHTATRRLHRIGRSHRDVEVQNS